MSTPSPGQLLNTLLRIIPVAPSAPVPTQMRTGRRYQISLNAEEFKTGSPNVTIVSPLCASVDNVASETVLILAGKKIKRRLEDLERRAGSSSASPEQSHAALVPQAQPRRKLEEGVKRQKSKSERQGTSRKPSPDRSSVPCGSAKDDRPNIYFQQYQRQCSASPPLSFNYTSSLSEQVIQAPYPRHAPFNALPSHFADYPAEPLYLPPLPVTLPSMSSFGHGCAKNEGLFSDEEMFGQFNLGYSPLTAMDIPGGQLYQESDLHVRKSSGAFSVYSTFFLFSNKLKLMMSSYRPLPCRIPTLSNTRGQGRPQRFSQAHQCRHPIRHA
jgi:hypothetical protein